MRLEGSCDCGAVHLSVESHEPYPYMRCYCKICRKTGGGGGYVINLKGDYDTLEVTGKEHIRIYQAWIKNPEDKDVQLSSAQRHFCMECGSALWVWDPRWPEMVHPFASAIDTPLPKAPEQNHIMLEFKPDWVPVEKGPQDQEFQRYPEESIEDWHKRLGLLDEKTA